MISIRSPSILTKLTNCNVIRVPNTYGYAYGKMSKNTTIAGDLKY